MCANRTGEAGPNTAGDHFLAVYRLLSASGAVLAIHGALPTHAHPHPLLFTFSTSLRAGGPPGPSRPHGFANYGSQFKYL